MLSKNSFFYSSSSYILDQSHHQHKKNLDQLRVLNYRLAVIRGIPATYSSTVLSSQNFFGQYGNILQISTSKLQSTGDISFIYITYQSEISAAFALKAAKNLYIDNCLVETCYGTTRYCISAIQKKQCCRQHCTFSHQPIDYANFNSPLPSFHQQSIYASSLISKKLFSILNCLYKEKLLEKSTKLFSRQNLYLQEHEQYFLARRKQKNRLATIEEILFRCFEAGQLNFKYFNEERVERVFNTQLKIMCISHRSNQIFDWHPQLIESIDSENENDVYYELPDPFLGNEQQQLDKKDCSIRKKLRGKLLTQWKRQRLFMEPKMELTEEQKAEKNRVRHAMMKILHRSKRHQKRN